MEEAQGKAPDLAALRAENERLRKAATAAEAALKKSETQRAEALNEVPEDGGFKLNVGNYVILRSQS